jgi:hypothetical protein
MSTDFFVSLSSSNIESKISALNCYGSQSFQKKSYFSEDYIWGIAKTRGVQISKPYAEAFEIIKFII